MISYAIRTTLLVSLVALIGCNRLGYETTRVATGSSAMVVSAHPLASAVGEQIMREGGNATDAAIATQFALAVVCPRAGNLGGGGFWVHAPAGDVVRAIDYREEAPAAATRDMYLDEDGEVIEGASTLGPLASGIPGTVDGLWTAYSFGSELQDWARLVRPAARLAREGFRISAPEAERLNRYDFINAEGSPYDRDAWSRGDRLVQTRLAATLDSIAELGPKYFYDGPFAARLAEEVRAAGGIWTAQDLSDYQSVWREPIATQFLGQTVYSMPPPSSGGVALAQMLTMLEPYDLHDMIAADSAEYYHLLIEVMRRAYEDRAEYLGDPDLVYVPVDSLLDPTYLALKMSSYDPTAATPSGRSVRAPGKETYETTHTSVIDDEGNAVSVTTTLNGNYGSKFWSREGGFFLNNEMDDFSSKPGVPNMFGLVGGEANAIAPGKRMLSSMTPTVVQRDGRNVLVLGTPGGSTIITAVLQTLLNATVHGQSLPDAVEQPRLHHQWLPDEVVYERGGFSEELLARLRALGHELRAAETLGRVKAVARDEDGGLTGVGDARNPDDDASGF